VRHEGRYTATGAFSSRLQLGAVYSFSLSRAPACVFHCVSMGIAEWVGAAPVAMRRMVGWEEDYEST
jgi:hypothetical protein